MTQANLARKFREQFGWEMPTRKLARIMYTERPLDFKDYEAARFALRSIEGKGSNHIKVSAEAPKEERPRNPYKLPESNETDFKPYKITGHKRIAIFSDIHVPYHSIDCITAALDFCKKEKPDALLLNGDTIDCHKLSRFIKDPSKRNFAQELETFKQLFDIFKKQLNCKIYFKVGNHEERYERFLS